MLAINSYLLLGIAPWDAGQLDNWGSKILWTLPLTHPSPPLNVKCLTGIKLIEAGGGGGCSSCLVLYIHCGRESQIGGGGGGKGHQTRGGVDTVADGNGGIPPAPPLPPPPVVAMCVRGRVQTTEEQMCSALRNTRMLSYSLGLKVTVDCSRMCYTVLSDESDLF